jgi:MOSC domain-containing protein YiiM
MARVTAVNISQEKGVIKEPIPLGYFKENHGLMGDAHAGKWHRQVSLLGQESIDKIAALGIEGLSAGKFAENLTTEGIDLYKYPVGTRIKIGEAVMEISQIGKKCHTKCAIFEQVGVCAMPLEGVFTKVIKGGYIRPGDEIEILE